MHHQEKKKKKKKKKKKRRANPKNPKPQRTVRLKTFCDTMDALRLMHAQLPNMEKVTTQPFVLRSQLYSSVKDRTQVDRDLEILRKEKVLRLFKLNTGQDDHAIMFVEDYLNQMSIAVTKIGPKSHDPVFEWFKCYVIDTKLDVSIDHNELCSLLSCGGKVNNDRISPLNFALLPSSLRLMNAGLLSRQLIDSIVYWFTIPNFGSMLKDISQA